MAIDLESMSLDELKALKKDVEKALTDFDKRQKQAALVAAQRAAQEHGFSLEEILGGKSGGKTSVPKYRNPDDASQTWTGRGRQPAWYKDARAAGKSDDDLAI